jgi:SHS2 domain-containing protein
MDASPTGHRQIDHTADLALEIWAPTEAELLAEAARAVVAIMIDEGSLDETARRELVLDPVDAEDRLVQWVNEIIYLAVTEGFVVARCRLDLHNCRLRAELFGQADAADRIAGELKSATYHDLLLERTDGGWRARLVIDV